MRLFLFLTLISLSIPAAEVIFDQSNEQVYSPFDTGFAGLSRFAILIKKMGAEVSLNSRALHKFLPEIDPKGKVLVLGVAMNKKYSPLSVLAIKNFLGDGGGVLVNVEHDNLFQNGSFQNELISQFGITAMPSIALGVGKNWSESIWPVCKSPEFNLKAVHFFLPAPLKLSGSAKPILYLKKPENNKKEIVAAWSKYKEGNLIVLGDQEVLWNMTPKSGIRKGQNPIFLQKVLKVLLKDNLIKPNITFKQNLPKTALFYTASYGIGPYNFISGLSSFAKELNINGYKIIIKDNEDDFKKYDLVILAAPLSTLKNIDKLLKAKKLLLISDGQTSILKNDERFMSQLVELGLNPNLKEYENPLNGLLKNFGLKFFDGTITQKGQNHYFFSSSKFPLFRGTFIKGKLLASAKVIAHGGSGITALYNSVPQSEDASKGKPFEPFQGTINQRRYPLVITTEKLMLISDLEFVSNQFFTKEKFNEIKSWLKI